ncbi:SUF system NifU family Fe-S cluster assembly protein [Candidatus Dojkabacteria bacterium]|nr:SUF system NifU family Fe-S cluster assembly protein [Candidatus Dojkabacteria bacterium]
MSNRSLYKSKIIDHYKNPRNFKEIKHADYKRHINNSVCGDEVTVYLKVKNNVIQDVGFQGSGCAISLAGASMLSEQIIGMSIDKVKKLDGSFSLSLMGIEKNSPRVKCATLSLEAVKRAIEDGDDEPCDFC